MAAESFGIASKSLELFIPRKETVPLERGTEGHDSDVAAAQEFEKRFLRPALVGQHALEAGAEIGVDPALQLEDSDGVRRGAHSLPRWRIRERRYARAVRQVITGRRVALP
ncbi:MAG: hypothetical protein ACJ78Y_00460 [Myxococcales bacterium]